MHFHCFDVARSGLTCGLAEEVCVDAETPESKEEGVLSAWMSTSGLHHISGWQMLLE